MPTVKLSPVFNEQTVTSAGVPASGYKVYTYAAGSTTAQATYTDSNGTTAQANPIILNANGLPANPIWLQSGLAYKFVLKDANDVTIETIDNVTGINDTSSAVSQWLSSNVAPTYVSASSFTLPGDQTTEFHAGRRTQFTVTAGTAYGNIFSSTYSAGVTTVSMTMDAGNSIDSGLSVVNLSILRCDKTALPSNYKFPATPLASSDVNTLDDYKEGSATLAAVCGTSGTITLGNKDVTYTKIGNMVFFTGIIDVSSVSSPNGTLTLTGLPYTSGNNNRNYSAIALRLSGGTNNVSGSVWQAYIAKNSSAISITYYNPATGTEGSSPASQCVLGTSFTIFGSYMVN